MSNVKDSNLPFPQPETNLFIVAMKLYRCLIGLALVVPANAGLMLQPSSVTSQLPMGETSGFEASHLIDQSGLATGYTSGVTDFDTYFGAGPTHNSGPAANIWASTGGNQAGNLDFDLGGSFAIESMALWNFGSNQPDSVIGLTLLADSDGSFSSPTILGSFTANTNTAPSSAVLPDVFSFAPTTASFVRVQVTSHNGGTFAVAGEVAFEAVPEASESLVILLGMSGLVAVRRRKRGGVATPHSTDFHGPPFGAAFSASLRLWA